jgi:hypothetical protein
MQLGLAVEHLEHARAGGDRALGHPERDSQHPHRRGQQHDVAVEGDELADRDRPVDSLAAADEEDRGQPQLGQEADRGVVERAQPGRHHRLVEHPPHGVLEPAQLALLLRERLDDPYSGHVLLGLGGQLGNPLLNLLRRGPVAAPVARRGVDDERRGGERDRRKPGVDGDHHGRGDQDRHRRLQHEDQAVAEKEPDRLQVDGRARHQLARLLAVEERQLERLQVAVHQVSQVELDAERHPAGDQPARDAEDEPQQPGAADRQRQHGERAAAAIDVVDRPPDEERDQHAGAHRRCAERERPSDPAPVGAQEAEQSPEGPHPYLLYVMK